MPKKRVIIIGGGNAALSAAIESAERGNEVVLVEAAPEKFRGGNSKYTRDIRYAHKEDEFTSGSYGVDELKNDLLSVTGTLENPEVAKMVLEKSEFVAGWMNAHGIIFKKEIKGTLNLSRTNAFFMGGGKVLVDTYYNLLKKLNVRVLYESPLTSIKFRNLHIENITIQKENGEEVLQADEYIFASGGYESNKEWLGQFWQEGVKNIKVRGTRYNMGKPLKLLMDNGAILCGEEKAGHMVAVDSRSPEYEAGIVSRIDAIPWGITVNIHGKRFYDEGEDIWPKRYAMWGRLIADIDEQKAYVVIDRKAIGKFMPTVYKPFSAETIDDLEKILGLPVNSLKGTVDNYNKGINKESSDLFMWSSSGSRIPKSHWAMPIDEPPFFAYPLSPGLTFTYQGVKINKTGRLMMIDGEVDNGFAAGEIASGNILKKGYLAGFGLVIGNVLGRVAGGWEND